MKQLDTIRWNLYCIEGWETANLTITKLFNKELKKLKLTENSERTLVLDAAKTLWKNMIAHFKKPIFTTFGTTDSDVEMALREAIQKTLNIWIDEGITCEL